MTGSLSKKPIWLKALAFGLSAMLSALAASAETPEPLPVNAQPAQETNSATRKLAPAAGDRSGSDIQIEELTAPDPNAAGALPAGMKPLGAGMWKSMRADELALRIARLPRVERSVVMQNLTTRMLLSPSAGPRDAQQEGVAPWFVARLRALNARGNWTGAAALAEFGPMSDPAVAEAAFTARLASWPRTDTCEALKTSENAHDGQFWSQLRIFCQLVAGDAAGAQLAFEVLREKNQIDPIFAAAAAKLLDGKAPANAPPPETAIHAAMWNLAALPLNTLAAQEDRPEIAALARATGENDIIKLAGLGALARQDASLAQTWSAAIANAQFSADQRDDPDEAAKKLPIAAGDAVYLQAIAARNLPAAKASMFAAMLQRGQSRGEFPYTAKLLARPALDIPPLPETAWAAPEVTRVLIYNGDVARAESWFKALSPGSPSDQPTINAVQIYGWLRQPTEARGAILDRALRWLVDTAEKPGQNRTIAQTRLAREAPVLAALGVVLPPEASSALDSNSPGVALGVDGPALLDGMARAADQGASGEVILNAALLLNGQGAAAARSQTVAAVVRALMKIGMRAEAKALALEALLGQGQRGL